MPKCFEGRIAIGGLLVFSFWLFVALPFLYGQSQQLPARTDQGRPPIAKEQSEPSKSHDANTAGNDQPAAVALTRGTPTNPLYVETTCDDQNRNAECNKGWWQKFWADPVATFTGLLFIATFFQTIFNFLAFKESSKANEAAKTAEVNTSSALIASNRPYVFVRDFIPIPIGNPQSPVGWRCVILWENSGTTPTLNLKMWVSWGAFTAPLPDNYSFPDMGDNRGESAVVIPPRGQVSTTVFTLDFERAIALMEGRQFVYLWGWAEYSDVFPNTPKRRTEFCVQVLVSLLSAEPAMMMVEFRHYRTHNSST